MGSATWVSTHAGVDLQRVVPGPPSTRRSRTWHRERRRRSIRFNPPVGPASHSSCRARAPRSPLTCSLFPSPHVATFAPPPWDSPAGVCQARRVSAGKAVAHCQRALQTMSRQEEVTSSCHTDRAPAAGSGAVLVRAVSGKGTFQTGGLRSHLPRTAVFILVAAYLRRLWPWVPKYLEAAFIRQIPLSSSYQTPCN